MRWDCMNARLRRIRSSWERISAAGTPFSTAVVSSMGFTSVDIISLVRFTTQVTRYMDLFNGALTETWHSTCRVRKGRLQIHARDVDRRAVALNYHNSTVGDV